MKRMLVLMLALAMVFALCACGEKAPADVAGRYYLVRAERNGTSYTLEELAELEGATSAEMYVDLRADGTAYVFSSMDGDVFDYEMRWGNGKMWLPENPDNVISYTIKGNTLTITNDGLKETFVKG